MTRYVVIPESQSAHCCFTHTVLDTSKKDAAGWHEAVCECFSAADAEKIAAALNAAEQATAKIRRSPYRDAADRQICEGMRVTHGVNGAGTVHYVPRPAPAPAAAYWGVKFDTHEKLVGLKPIAEDLRITGESK